MDSGQDLDPPAADGRARTQMTPADRERVKLLFEEARRLPDGARSMFLAARAEDASVLAEVDSLLRVYESAPDFLESPAPAVARLDEPPPSPAPLAGRRFGPWLLVREIGRGGMGVVWEARRADG